MDGKKKGEYIGMLGALLVHVAIIALLILVSFTLPNNQDEGGVPVMMGDVDASLGNYDPSTMVDVDVLPPEDVSEVVEPQETVEQEMITQTEEETVVIKPKAEPKKEKPEVVKKPEKAAAEAAAKRVSGAFGKGAQMDGSKGTANSGTGVEGSKDGNSSSGAKTGTGGYGTFDLGGRSIGEGGLPRPVYNVQEEGRVVVSITVNPAGHVIATSINRQTNTVNTALRKAAEDAAKRARFNAVEGVNNQTGTITYYFNLR